MRISEAEVKRILQSAPSIVSDIIELEEGLDEAELPIDAELVRDVVKRVSELPDRDDIVAELKAQIEAGAYKPKGEEIAEAMIRRAIADRAAGRRAR